MKKFLSMTFGGLDSKYLFRQYIYSMILGAISYSSLVSSYSFQEQKIALIIFVVINSVLYPYSRFVYESLIEFMMGDNVLFVNAIVLFTTKLLTMIICWFFSLFIAPVGLAYIFYHHWKNNGAE